ncbi:MAG: arsenate reductase (glutaredoxin) [Flavobacteriales bacterium]|nr:arsenate reductase (glutaredoxin) [Flavobacteriales bacterium]
MIQIYHNPRCTKSRETLALLEEKNQEVEIVEYLKDIPSKSDLKKILSKLNIKPEQLLRKNEAIFKEKFKGLSFNDEEWIQIMIENPKLIQRPIVINGNKARIGRPPELVLEIL